MPISYISKGKESFTNHSFELEENDQVYLFTDGITDQFNGINNQKLTRKRFKELLLSFEHLTMDQQFLKFNTAFDVWQGNIKQVDDMLLIGLKIT